MEKGWLKIEGVQDGDRTLDEQMLGMDKALDMCKGKTVIDFGCAEGLIAIAFANAGASSVIGYDYKESYVKRAKEMLKAQKTQLPVRFVRRDLSIDFKYPEVDIVLALAIIHKFRNPVAGVMLCAKVAKEAIVIRLPIGSAGIIASKHNKATTCDSIALLRRLGWTLTSMVDGARGELVHYWEK